jgi:hypothetical protein
MSCIKPIAPLIEVAPLDRRRSPGDHRLDPGDRHAKLKRRLLDRRQQPRPIPGDLRPHDTGGRQGEPHRSEETRRSRARRAAFWSHPANRKRAAVLVAVKGSAPSAPAQGPPLTATARDRRRGLGRDEERSVQTAEQGKEALGDTSALPGPEGAQAAGDAGAGKRPEIAAVQTARRVGVEQEDLAGAQGRHPRRASGRPR